MANYFDHLLSLDTPLTQSHRQRSASSRVLYCGHSTQCSVCYSVRAIAFRKISKSCSDRQSHWRSL